MPVPSSFQAARSGWFADVAAKALHELGRSYDRGEFLVLKLI